MKYEKQVSIIGSWIDKSKIVNGMQAKIVSETRPVPSQFQDDKGNIKNQDVCKVKVRGFTEEMNVPLNRATIAGLIDAFGEDSNDWIGHTLTVETEKMRVAGRAVVALYLIPAGFERIDDANGYAVIARQKPHNASGSTKAVQVEQSTNEDDLNAELQIEAENQKINVKDIPF